MSFAGSARSLLKDIALLLFVVLLFPVGILLVGTPIAVCVRAIVALAHHL